MRIFVDKDVAQFANLFTWEVYTSNNGTDWVLEATINSADFDSFTNTFDVKFSTVDTRFIKVAVESLVLAPGQDPSNQFQSIIVTAIQPLLIQPVGAVERETQARSHQYNLSTRALLLKNPRLNYDFTLYYTKSEPIDSSRYVVTNSLSASRQFYRWLNGHARVSREDSHTKPDDRGYVRHDYSAGLNIDPLPTLSHNLSYHGSHETADGKTTITNGISLFNKIALYQGVNLQLGGNIGFNSMPDDVTSKNYRLIYTLGVNPHRVISFNLTGTLSHSTQSKPGEPDKTNTKERRRLTVSFRPLTTLSLTMAMEQEIDDGDSQILKRFNTQWSPLSAGSLRFSLSYVETHRPENDGIYKSTSAAVRWELRPGTDIDVSLSENRDDTPFQYNKGQTVFVSIKTRF